MDSPPIINPKDVPDGMTPRQDWWDSHGCWHQGRIAESSESYVIKRFPFENASWGFPFLKSLGSLDGKTVLDLGCGLGYISVYAARAGAKVMATDLRLEMLRAARMIADINGVTYQFYQANISKLPIVGNSVDIAIGMRILHHLSKPDVQTAINEVYRVLRNGGKAVFIEPVENSMVFNFIQNLFPTGRKGSAWYRPSCLCPRAWQRYLAQEDDRDMNRKELVDAGVPFKRVLLTPFGFLNRLDRLVGSNQSKCLLNSIDHFVFQFFPFLKQFSREIMVEYQK
jgi:2-polyprenyl-3-methyl-5-hydroxy-6-metoxy-1,4-benzoquinol methylase